MLFNKKKRIQYFGFDDFWFVIIGIIVFSFVSNYLFNNSSAGYSLGEATINWAISLFFTICNWLLMRVIMVFLRKRYPAFHDNIKRIALLLIALIITVLSIDIIGGNFLAYILNGNYHFSTRYKVLLPIVLISIMIQAIYEAIYLYVRLEKLIREEEQAKQVIVLARLDALRNQAQPHFLFNSLNTLRDIIDQNPKEDAKKFVDKLSDVYRFILDSGNANLTSLRDELRFAKAYIHIQSERFGDNLKVNWNIPEVLLDLMIVPMSLQLLLENAIKHNVISKAKPLVINVLVARVAVIDNVLVVSNKIQSKSTQLPSTKVGLKNIKKRYTLISNKSPEIENDGKQFIVSLPLLQPSDQKKNYASTDH